MISGDSGGRSGHYTRDGCWNIVCLKPIMNNFKFHSDNIKIFVKKKGKAKKTEVIALISERAEAAQLKFARVCGDS